MPHTFRSHSPRPLLNDSRLARGSARTTRRSRRSRHGSTCSWVGFEGRGGRESRGQAQHAAAAFSVRSRSAPRDTCWWQCVAGRWGWAAAPAALPRITLRFATPRLRCPLRQVGTAPPARRSAPAWSFAAPHRPWCRGACCRRRSRIQLRARPTLGPKTRVSDGAVWASPLLSPSLTPPCLHRPPTRIPFPHTPHPTHTHTPTHPPTRTTTTTTTTTRPPLRPGPLLPARPPAGGRGALLGGAARRRFGVLRHLPLLQARHPAGLGVAAGGEGHADSVGWWVGGGVNAAHARAALCGASARWCRCSEL